MKISIKVNIYGLVQNVGFRYSTKVTAESLNIKGYVKNMHDGSVFVEAQGDKENIEKFIQWCKTGPSSARVDEVDVEYISERQFENFVIK